MDKKKRYEEIEKIRRRYFPKDLPFVPLIKLPPFGSKLLDHKSPFVSYTMAILCVAIAAFLKLEFSAIIGEETPYLLFFFACLVSAWFGGLGPGLFATVLSALVVDYFFLSPLYTFNDFYKHVSIVVFLFEGMGISILSEVRLRSVKAFRESNERMTAVFESINDAFVAVDTTWRFTYVNSQVEKLLGRTSEELIGTDFWDAFHEARGTKGERRLQKAMDKQRTVEYERYNEQFMKWMEVRAFPGNNGLSIYFQDITRRKIAEEKLKESEEIFRLLVEGARDYAIFLLDADGNIRSWNKGAQNLLGYTKREVLGKHVSLFYTQEDIQSGMVTKEMDTSIRRGRAEDENWLVRKDGSRFWASGSTTSTWDDDGYLQGLVKIAHDVSKRQEFEKRKDEFISIASHELKTPITSLKVYTQIIKKRFEKDENKDGIQFVSRMDAQINRLINLVGDLLNVSKIQTGKLDLREELFDFDELIHNTVKDLQHITKHHLILKGTMGYPLYADKDRISQAVINLINNAIKYSPTSDKVIISVEGNKRQLTVRVQDFGVGISKENKERIFERFFRGNSENNLSSGLGLGLYITAEVIKRHGGKIWVESTKGKGTTFSFSLPLRHPKEE